MDNNAILQAVQQLATGIGNSVAPTPVPTLQYTAPNVQDLSSQFQTFLTRASQDPDIVNYYNQLLKTAQGDTATAIGYLQDDYSTGVRNTITNLNTSLKSLSQTNKANQVSQQDSLNKRGIALTQGADGKLSYGGGGQAQSEIGQTQQNYALQQEAQQRSASQTVQAAGQQLKEGISGKQQALTQAAQGLQGQMNQDVGTRANTYMDLYNAKQAADEKAAADKAARAAAAGPAPDMPRPGTSPYHVDQRIGGYRWTGANWEVVQ